MKRSLKLAAKKNDTDVCKVLAKEIVQSRKAISRIYTAKANISSIEMTMKNQAGDWCFSDTVVETYVTSYCMVAIFIGNRT